MLSFRTASTYSLANTYIYFVYLYQLFPSELDLLTRFTIVMESIRAKKLGTDLFFFHIKYNHSDEVLNMLRRGEVDVNDRDINGFTALHVKPI